MKLESIVAVLDKSLKRRHISGSLYEWGENKGKFWRAAINSHGIHWVEVYRGRNRYIRKVAE